MKLFFSSKYRAEVIRINNSMDAEPNDTGIIFPILSITRPFTAMVMLKLQEEGQLPLQDKLSQHVIAFH